MFTPTPSPLLRAQLGISVMALLASTLAGPEIAHRSASAGAVTEFAQVAPASVTAMPTIQIAFRLTAAETETGSANIVDSAATIGVADSNIWTLDAAGVDQNLSLMQSIGVTSVRLPVPWTYIEPQNGTLDWSQMDMIIDAARAHGMSIVGTITGNPAWDGTVNIGQPNVQKFADFAGAVASRYSTRISAFEIWNEENSQGFFNGPNAAAAYTAVLKAAYTAIKAVAPTATVLVGGLASVPTIAGLELSPQKFLSQILANGAAGYFDAIAYHPYNLGTQLSQGGNLFESPINQLKALRAGLDAYGLNEIEIWATEYGEPTTPGLASPAQQAAYIQNFVVHWQALANVLNLGPAYVYTARDTDSGALNDEANYGLFYTDGTPKPAALVLKELEYALQHNLPLPSLESTIFHLTPGQQVAFVLSEAMQWMKLQVKTVTGFAKFLAGAALGTFEALPPVNLALGAIGAVLNAIGAVPPLQAAFALAASALKTLGAVGAHVEATVAAATFHAVAATVDAVVGVGTKVGAAAQAATGIPVAAVGDSPKDAAKTAVPEIEPAPSPVAATVGDTPQPSGEPANAPAGEAAAGTDATGDAAAATDNTAKHPRSAAKHRKAKSAESAGATAVAKSTGKTTDKTAGKHRRDDKHRSHGQGGRHRK